MAEKRNIYDDIAMHFGFDHADGYAMLLRAARALLTIGVAYLTTPSDSPEEAMAGATYDRMIDKLMEHPDKGKEMIECLVTIIYHLDGGGTLEQFFGAMDLEATRKERND